MRKRLTLSFFHVVLIILISLGLGYFIGVNKISSSWKGFTPIVSIERRDPPANQNLDMGLFYQILDKVNHDYYDKSKIDSKKILYGAVTGMLQSLDDPYTSFFPPKQNSDFKTQMAGEFSGIGAELGMNADNKIMVISPLDQSPAEKAGIKSGDLILSVDGKDTSGWTLPQAVEHIRGLKGTDVKLVILPNNTKTPKTLTITRDTIIVKSVKSWVKEFSCSGSICKEETNCPPPAGGCASVAYVRLSQFGDKTNDEWIRAVNDIQPKISQKKNFKGIILDLRNNPGGYLQDAVFIASEFLKSGVVVSEIDGAGQKTDLSVSRTGTLLDEPLIVLINGGSASASEIVSGALRDHGRAKLLGEKSFGKGTIQEPVDVEGGASVHVSVGKWITPNGTWVNKTGLKPDILVKFDEKKSKLTPGFDNQLISAIQELSK